MIATKVKSSNALPKRPFLSRRSTTANVRCLLCSSGSKSIAATADGWLARELRYSLALSALVSDHDGSPRPPSRRTDEDRYEARPVARLPRDDAGGDGGGNRDPAVHLLEA